MSSRKIRAMAQLINEIEKVTNSYTDYYGFYQMIEAIQNKIRAYRMNGSSPTGVKSLTNPINPLPER